MLSDNLSFYDYALMSIKTSSNCVTHKSFPELYVTCTEAECVPLDPLKLPLDIFGYPINKAELIEGINNDLDNQSNLKFFQCGFSKEQTIHI